VPKVRGSRTRGAIIACSGALWSTVFKVKMPDRKDVKINFCIRWYGQLQRNDSRHVGSVLWSAVGTIRLLRTHLYDRSIPLLINMLLYMGEHRDSHRH